MFCVFLYGPFCLGAHKLDFVHIVYNIFLWTSLPIIVLCNITTCEFKTQLKQLNNKTYQHYKNNYVLLYMYKTMQKEEQTLMI